MRNLVLAAIAASAVFATSAQAAEPALMTNFKNYCVAHSGTPGAANAAAVADGYTPYEGPMPSAGEMQDAKVVQKVVDGRTFLVFTGVSHDAPKKGLPATDGVACGVMVKDKDPAALTAFQAWVGFAPMKSFGSMAIYTYRDGAGGRTAIGEDDTAATKAAVDAGEFSITVSADLEVATMIVLVHSRTAAPVH